MVLILVDIDTERKRVDELTTADRSKNEFLAMLAHELRNPLAPLRHAVQVLKDPGADSAMLERAREVMARQIQNMARMIDDLLDVSRIKQGKIQLRKEPVELAAILARAVEVVRSYVEASSQELSVSLLPEPVYLEADPIRLEQLFGNLLTNASKFTASGGHIWLTLEMDERRGDAEMRGRGEKEEIPASPLPRVSGSHVVVRIRDDGSGIAPELLPRVFDLFMQADRSLERPHGGLGIGLTLVKSVVELHGGSVEAYSAGLGQGSEFLVRLPTLSRSASHLRESPPKETSARKSVSLRLLVVDDNVDAADVLAMFLQLAGHEVKVAHGGPAALGIAATFQPQVILLDIGLPGMNGYEAARQLRQLPGLEKVLLVAVTGYGEDHDRRQAQEAGFDHHLTKPVDPEALGELLAHSAARSV